MPTTRSDTPARQWAAFLSKYDPAIAARAKAAVARMRKSVPGAVELVYDNYNALVVGFGPSERASEAVLSIALYPRWVTLFFLQGARLSDPARLLKGAGKRVRHIVLTDLAILDEPAVRGLIGQAVATAPRPIDARARRRMVIRSVSAKQRSRRPARARVARSR
ncbi:MAG TPA: hypothetical protein VFS78_14835 [Vicinamibacteria bacterium]|nr:hypothetical protein [Vicinamibacteria bacterium]